jgi:hypothetical protein
MSLKSSSNRRIVKYGMAIVKKPYPKRIEIGNTIMTIIGESICEYDDISTASGRATDKILKVIQNNYRRRRK